MNKEFYECKNEKKITDFLCGLYTNKLSLLRQEGSNYFYFLYKPSKCSHISHS